MVFVGRNNFLLCIDKYTHTGCVSKVSTVKVPMTEEMFCDHTINFQLDYNLYKRNSLSQITSTETLASTYIAMIPKHL